MRLNHIATCLSFFFGWFPDTSTPATRCSQRSSVSRRVRGCKTQGQSHNRRMTTVPYEEQNRDRLMAPAMDRNSQIPAVPSGVAGAEKVWNPPTAVVGRADSITHEQFFGSGNPYFPSRAWRGSVRPPREHRFGNVSHLNMQCALRTVPRSRARLGTMFRAAPP